jgi:hypothetical protein
MTSLLALGYTALVMGGVVGGLYLFSRVMQRNHGPNHDYPKETRDGSQS